MPTINLEIPDELHREAKAKAAVNGIYLKDYLLKLIKEGLERGDRR